jgi:hypothetical protein
LGINHQQLHREHSTWQKLCSSNSSAYLRGIDELKRRGNGLEMEWKWTAPFKTDRVDSRLKLDQNKKNARGISHLIEARNRLSGRKQLRQHIVASGFGFVV